MIAEALGGFLDIQSFDALEHDAEEEFPLTNGFRVHPIFLCKGYSSIGRRAVHEAT